jgi:hypothetical protein
MLIRCDTCFVGFRTVAFAMLYAVLPMPAAAQLTHSSGKENRNVVLRYLTFRKGTGPSEDSITFAGSGLGTDMILDHVSASWAEDEILSVANNNTNVTVQYSMINDAKKQAAR